MVPGGSTDQPPIGPPRRCALVVAPQLRERSAPDAITLTGSTGERAHRHLRLELPALGRRALRPGHAARRAAGRLHRPVRHRRAQRQLLPLAADRTFAGWRRRLPDGFVMCVKAPRGLTHAKRLYAPEAWVGPHRRPAGTSSARDAACSSCSSPPPRSATTPASTTSSAHCAVDRRRRRAAPPELAGRRRVRHPRTPRRGVRASMSGADLPCVLRATASFVYVRLHGPDHDAPLRRLVLRRRPALVGRRASGVGARRARRATCTSTTTATATPCATRGRCARCSGGERVRGRRTGGAGGAGRRRDATPTRG